MSEKDLLRYIKRLKQLIWGIAGTAIIAIAGQFFMSWQTATINTTKIEIIEKMQDAQQIAIDEKADMKVVLGIKETLEQKIVDKFDVIEGKLDLVLQLSPTYNYYDNSKTK